MLTWFVFALRCIAWRCVAFFLLLAACLFAVLRSFRSSALALHPLLAGLKLACLPAVLAVLGLYVFLTCMLCFALRCSVDFAGFACFACSACFACFACLLACCYLHLAGLGWAELDVFLFLTFRSCPPRFKGFAIARRAQKLGQKQRCMLPGQSNGSVRIK